MDDRNDEETRVLEKAKTDPGYRTLIEDLEKPMQAPEGDFRSLLGVSFRKVRFFHAETGGYRNGLFAQRDVNGPRPSAMPYLISKATFGK